jgi:hypothetical protein
MLQVKSAQERWEQRLEWVERTLGREIIKRDTPRGPDPSSDYANPKDVLADPALTQPEKRDKLQRWALDAYLIERALPKGHAVSRQSRLDEVIDALIDLDENKRASDLRQPARTDSAA